MLLFVGTDFSGSSLDLAPEAAPLSLMEWNWFHREWALRGTEQTEVGRSSRQREQPVQTPWGRHRLGMFEEQLGLGLARASEQGEVVGLGRGRNEWWGGSGRTTQGFVAERGGCVSGEPDAAIG